MKKLAVVIVLGLTLNSFTSIKQSPIEQTKTMDCNYGQCMKIKDDGKRCRNCAQQGSSYCWSHRN